MKLETMPSVQKNPAVGSARMLGSSGSAASALAELPANKSVLLNRAYAEFCERWEQGERPDPDAYCARFPSMKVALGRLLQAHLYCEENFAIFAKMPETRFPEAGETFLDFQLKLELGRGSFARVYLATEPKLGNRLVAVKVALQGGAEADVLGRIQHPNIVPVHSVQDDRSTGLTAVCMPYAGSATLYDVFDKAFTPGAPLPERAQVILDAAADLPYPLDPAQPAAVAPVLQDGTYIDGVRWIGARLADALAFIHERGIHHRDLKPSNVLLSPQGVPMLLDFNLCNDVTEALHQLGGTFQYMSPEQLRAVAEKDPTKADSLDARSDIFSFGVILYQMATGQHPHVANPLNLSTADLLTHLLEAHKQTPTEPSRLNPHVDPALSRLIVRCLAYEPNDRPQTAAEIAQALQPAPVQAARRLRRHPGKLMAAGLLLGAALVAAGLTYGALQQAPGDPPAQSKETPLETGLRLHQQGRYREAIEPLNLALQAEPKSVEARLARAHALLQLGAVDKAHYSSAINDYVEADRLRPDGRNKAAIAYCYNRLDREEAIAIHLYEQSIEVGFSVAEIHNNVGYCYLRLSKVDPAKKCLDQAIELDPKLQAAYHNRAIWAIMAVVPNAPKLTQADKGKAVYGIFEAGVADFKKAIELGAPSSELHFDAARLYALGARMDRRWVEPAIEQAAEAIKQGHDPSKLSDLIFRSVKDEPAFQTLAKRPATGQPPVPTPRIADPIR